MNNYGGDFLKKIKITNRTQATCDYFNLPLPNLLNYSESYKNSEVNQTNSQILVIDTVASEKLLSDIEWGVETLENVKEKAGLLIGYRCKSEDSDMWGLVTDIIPFKYTKSNRRSIKMTSDSFYDASCRVFPKLSEINPDIEIIGWYHTHTYSDQPVFSATDYQTQTSTFASIPDC